MKEFDIVLIFIEFIVTFKHNLMPLPPREKYIDETDELIIEDESQRVSLTGNIPIQSCVTGEN